MFFSLIIALTVSFIFGYEYGHNYLNRECPREIKGYNCKGLTCNHDRDAVLQALLDMEKE